MITKEDGLLDLSADPFQNFKKFQAYFGWPGTYFFSSPRTLLGKKLRVVITDADFENGQFTIKKVIPEGKKEMGYEEFLRGNKAI